MQPQNQPVGNEVLKTSQDTKKLCIIFIIINLVIFIGAGVMFFYYTRSQSGVDLTPVEVKVKSNAEDLVEKMEPFPAPAAEPEASTSTIMEEPAMATSTQ
ncbi:MAG: hypothetical protein ACOYUZ_04415 [Patescibacteria group bacterium]